MRPDSLLIPLEKPECIDTSKISWRAQEPQVIEMQDLSRKKERKTVREYFRSGLRWIKSRFTSIKRTFSNAFRSFDSDSEPLISSNKFNRSVHYCPDCHVVAKRKFTWECILLSLFSCGAYCCCNVAEYQCPQCGFDIIDSHLY